MKRIFTLACFIAACVAMMAESKPFRIDMLFYRVNEADMTAKVVMAPPQYDYSYAYAAEKYVIPDSVSYEGRDYVVTAVGDSALMNYMNTTEVVLPSTLKTIGVGAFYDTPKLTSLTLPEGLKKIGGSAFSSSGVQLTAIPNSVEEIGDYAFNKCNEITSVTLPTGLKVLGENVFQSCSSLASVVIPEGTISRLPDRTFYSCTSLTDVKLPSKITYMGLAVFAGCTSLSDITLPESLQFVDLYSIYECPSLTTIQCNALTPPMTDRNPFDESLYTQATLLVPKQSIEAYKAANGWKGFFNISDIPTAIDKTAADAPSAAERIYDLRGVEMQSEKGIYIKGGKIKVASR